MLMMMVLLALYILSWGPSSWLFFNGHIVEGGIVHRTMNAVYEPIFWVFPSDGYTEGVLEGYLRLWVPNLQLRL